MSDPAVQQKLQQAVQLHQMGKLREAEPLYRQILARQPNHPDALHLLGVLASQAGNPAAGEPLIRQAIRLQPQAAAYHGSLGLALAGMGKLDDAIAAYRHAIRLQSNLPDVHSNLGNALRLAGRPDEAVAAFQAALAKNPNDPIALANYGIAMKDQGRIDDAITAYRRAVATRPNMPEIHYNLGIALRLQGKTDDAIAAYEKAIALRPGYVEAVTNLGNVLTELGRRDEAVAFYHRAIRIRPDHPEAYYNLGVAMKEKGKIDAAIAAYERAIALRPHHAEAITNLGNAFRDTGLLDGGIACYRRTLAIKPDDHATWSNLLYAVYFHPDYDAKRIFELHAEWGRRFAKSEASSKSENPTSKLRIGFVSPDFREHCQSFFTIPLLENLDREKFHLVAYSNWPRPDAYTNRIRGLFDEWREIAALRDDAAAQRVRDDRIDILIDLTVHMARNRLPLFAMKPAPVQATWLGYPGSTGLAAVDWRITDAHLDPPRAEIDANYIEKSLRLSSFWCYNQPLDEAVTPVPPCEARGHITFGCFNNFCKVTRLTLDLWAKTMLAVEDSRLLVLADRGSHRQRTADALRDRGVGPSRVEFLDKRPPREYLKLYHGIDVALDTFPYTGHTTTLDALWMGVPVVTLAGETAVSRGGLSILTNLGLPEFVAHTHEDYVRVVRELTSDRPRLRELRTSLRGKMAGSILTDGKHFAKEFGEALLTMWRSHRESHRF